jgi:hypothetical protein
MKNEPQPLALVDNDKLWLDNSSYRSCSTSLNNCELDYCMWKILARHRSLANTKTLYSQYHIIVSLEMPSKCLCYYTTYKFTSSPYQVISIWSMYNPFHKHYKKGVMAWSKYPVHSPETFTSVFLGMYCYLSRNHTYHPVCPLYFSQYLCYYSTSKPTKDCHLSACPVSCK